MDASPPALPLALIGAAITLPANIKTREEFYEVIRDKRQVSKKGVKRGPSNQGQSPGKGEDLPTAWTGGEKPSTARAPPKGLWSRPRGMVVCVCVGNVCV